MKRLFALVWFCAISCCLHAQPVDATICEILKNPQAFNGKTIRLKGTIEAGFDQFVVKGPNCGQQVNGIWLSYPEGTKAKSGPWAVLQLQPAKNFGGTVSDAERTPVQLDKNKDFKQFDTLLAAPYKGSGVCLGCGRYAVSATLVGRLDGTMPGLKRDSTGKIVGISGFGNLNAYSAQLLLQSVSDVTSQDIDYSKNAAAASGDSSSGSGAGSKLSTEFGSHSVLKEQPKRATEAFGKEGDDNGVEVTFGATSEFSPKSESKSQSASPDGVLFNCKFDGDRLKGDLMGRAMTHLGEHIADLRNPEPGTETAGMYQLEYRGWLTTMLGAIQAGQKNLMLPGGYTVWNASWPQPSLNKNTDDALTGFLTSEAQLNK
ncbi:MAG: hypothetical protein ABSF28_19745 [Terracidiphilus sp.]|jgi:hypothetical protein